MPGEPTETPVEPNVQPDTSKTDERNLIFLVFDAESGKISTLSDKAPRQFTVDPRKGKWHFTEEGAKYSTQSIGTAIPFSDNPGSGDAIVIYGVYDRTNTSHLRSMIRVILDASHFVSRRHLDPRYRSGEGDPEFRRLPPP